MTKVLCNIYKSRRKEETYLFVSLKDDLSRVPDVLLETFGRPELVTKMLIRNLKNPHRLTGSCSMQESLETEK